MAQRSSVLSELAEEDLIEPGILANVIREKIETDEGIFRLSGSLLDYEVSEFTKLLRFKRSGARIEYKLSFDWGEELGEGNIRNERNRLKDSFLRAGVIEHANVSNVIDRLRQHDDIIVGIDTNILWDCIITSQLLERVYEQPFPNWILFAVPKLVMAETENAANVKINDTNHPRSGWPTYKARLAQRGLQELMNLRQRDPNRPGLAVMTVGELRAEYDEVDKRNWKLDSQIRTQFQEFLGDISFHKGTFFLSQDRVNVMMSGTEGADGLYLQKPDLNEFRTGEFSVEEFTELIYELAVQFGGIHIESTGDVDFEMNLDVFWPGKQVSDWRKSRVKLTDLSST